MPSKKSAADKVSLCTKIRAIVCPMLINLSIGSYYSFSNINPYIAKYMNVPPENTIIVMQIWLLVQSLFAIVGVKMSEKLGYWLVNYIAFASFAVLNLIVSFVKNPVLFVGLYGVLAGVSIGIGYLPALYTAWTYFPKRKSLATGVILLCAGMSASFLSPLSTLIANPHNLPPEHEDYGKNVPLLFRCYAIYFGAIAVIACSLQPQPLTSDQFKTVRSLKKKLSRSKIAPQEHFRTSETLKALTTIYKSSEDSFNDEDIQAVHKNYLHDDVNHISQGQYALAAAHFDENRLADMHLQNLEAESSQNGSTSPSDDKGDDEPADEVLKNKELTKIEQDVDMIDTDRKLNDEESSNKPSDNVPGERTDTGANLVAPATLPALPSQRHIGHLATVQPSYKVVPVSLHAQSLDTMEVRKKHHHRIKGLMAKKILMKSKELKETHCPSMKYAVKSFSFWCIVVMSIGCSIQPYFLNSNWKTYYLHKLPAISDSQLSFILTFGSTANSIVRVLIGILLLKVDGKYLFFGVIALSIFGAFSIAAILKSYAVGVFLVMLAYMGLGCQVTLFPTLCTKVFGSSVGSKVYPYIYLCFSISNFLQYFAYSLYGKKSDKNIETMFYVFGSFAVIGTVFGIFFKSKPDWSKEVAQAKIEAQAKKDKKDKASQ